MTTYLRYGHSSVQVSQDSVLIYGGFGFMNSCLAQGRLDSVVLVQRKFNSEWIIKQLPVTGESPSEDHL